MIVNRDVFLIDKVVECGRPSERQSVRLIGLVFEQAGLPSHRD